MRVRSCPGRSGRKGSLRWALVAVTCLVVSAFAARAHSQPSAEPEVDREGAPECPGPNELARSIARNLGAKSLGSFPAHIRFEHLPQGYRATIDTFGDHPGQRVIDAQEESCVALGEAVATSLALIFEEPVPSVSAALRPPIAPPAADTHPIDVDASGGLAQGLTRGTAPMLRVGAGLERSWGFFQGGIGWVLPRSTELPPGSVAVMLVAADARACGSLVQGTPSLALCAGISGGVIHGAGHDYTAVATSNQPWFAGLLGAESRFSLSTRSFLFARGDLVASGRRHAFFVENRGTALTTDILGGTLALGVGLQTN